MYQNIITTLAILTPIIIVGLTYWREVKTKRESEIYLRKLKFYEDLIDYMNKTLYGEDESRGKDFGKLYNKSFIFSNDKVINGLNELFLEREKSPGNIVPITKAKEIYIKILLDCRHDLGIKTKFNIDEFDYKLPTG